MSHFPCMTSARIPRTTFSSKLCWEQYLSNNRRIPLGPPGVTQKPKTSTRSNVQPDTINSHLFPHESIMSIIVSTSATIYVVTNKIITAGSAMSPFPPIPRFFFLNHTRYFHNQTFITIFRYSV